MDTKKIFLVRKENRHAIVSTTYRIFDTKVRRQTIRRHLFLYQIKTFRIMQRNTKKILRKEVGSYFNALHENLKALLYLKKILYSVLVFYVVCPSI